MRNQKSVRTAEYKIGKVLYCVSSFVSESAKDTMDQKVNKLLCKDIKLHALRSQTEAAREEGAEWNRKRE